MSQCFREITNTYPLIDVPKASNLDCFADFKGLTAASQGKTSVSKAPGVEVSKEKDNIQNVKAQTFEERLAQLGIPSAVIENKVGIDIFKDSKEQQEFNADTTMQVESLLKQAIRDIRLLKLRVDDLEVEAMDRQQELDSVHQKNKTHERLIRRFAGPEHVDFQQEYEYDSTTEPSKAQKAQPRPDLSF